MPTYKIARRAYGEYTEIERFTGTWVEAMNKASLLQRTAKDGEYFVFLEHEEIRARPAPYGQSTFDYL